MTYCHVYRTQSGILRVIGGQNREWKGRASTLVASYLVWEDGRMTPIAPRCMEKAS